MQPVENAGGSPSAIPAPLQPKLLWRPGAFPLLLGTSVLIGALWWVLADDAFQGNARSLFGVNAVAVALAALAAFAVARSWRGRLVAFLLVVALVVLGLVVAWVGWNLANPSRH